LNQAGRLTKAKRVVPLLRGDTGPRCAREPGRRAGENTMSANNAKLRATLRKNSPQTESRVDPATDEEGEGIKQWRADVFPPAVSTPSKKTPKEAPPMTIDEFCERYALSRSHYFELKQEGRTPAELRVGRKTLITATSAREWERHIVEQQKTAVRVRRKS
jgi:hypothetical protein